MPLLDSKRPTGHFSLFAQDEPGGPFRLTRHATQEDASRRINDTPGPQGLTVHESDGGQIIHRPKGMTSEEAARLIDLHQGR